MSSTTGMMERFKRYPSQLTGTADSFSKIVADAECNSAQRSIAVGKSDAPALYQTAEA
jgi:hypothetical protein